MYANEKHPGGVTVMLWVSTKAWTPPVSSKMRDTPADMQQLVNQRAKLRCDFWQPDFRPPARERISKTDRSILRYLVAEFSVAKGGMLQNGPYTMKCGVGGYVLKQNIPFRTIVKRDTPPGWTAVLTEGVTIRSPLARVPCFGAPLRRKIGKQGDLPTDGKSPAQVYGETP